MSSGDNFSYHPTQTHQDPNSRRAPLPSVPDNSAYPFPQQQPQAGGYLRPEQPTRQPQQWPYPNEAAPPFAPPQQPQTYQNQGYGTGLEIGSQVARSNPASAALVSPAIISPELATASLGGTRRSAAAPGSEAYNSTARSSESHAQRLLPHAAADIRNATVAQAVSNYLSAKLKSQTYQQPQQVEQNYRQQTAPQAQYYTAQEQSAPVRQAPTSTNYNSPYAPPSQTSTGSAYYKLSPPQTTQPLVRQRSVDRNRTQQQQTQQKRPNGAQAYQQSTRQHQQPQEQPQVEQTFQYGQVSPAAAPAQIYQATPPAPAPYATASLPQRSTGVNSGFIQRQEWGYDTRQPSAAPVQQPTRQTEEEIMPQAHTIQQQQQHRGWTSPRMGQDNSVQAAPSTQSQHGAKPQQPTDAPSSQARQAPRKKQQYQLLSAAAQQLQKQEQQARDAHRQQKEQEEAQRLRQEHQAREAQRLQQEQQAREVQRLQEQQAQAQRLQQEQQDQEAQRLQQEQEARDAQRQQQEQLRLQQENQAREAQRLQQENQEQEAQRLQQAQSPRPHYVQQGAWAREMQRKQEQAEALRKQQELQRAREAEQIRLMEVQKEKLEQIEKCRKEESRLQEQMIQQQISEEAQDQGQSAPKQQEAPAPVTPQKKPAEPTTRPVKTPASRNKKAEPPKPKPRLYLPDMIPKRPIEAVKPGAVAAYSQPRTEPQAQAQAQAQSRPQESQSAPPSMPDQASAPAPEAAPEPGSATVEGQVQAPTGTTSQPQALTPQPSTQISTQPPAQPAQGIPASDTHGQDPQLNALPPHQATQGSQSQAPQLQGWAHQAQAYQAQTPQEQPHQVQTPQVYDAKRLKPSMNEQQLHQAQTPQQQVQTPQQPYMHHQVQQTPPLQQQVHQSQILRQQVQTPQSSQQEAQRTQPPQQPDQAHTSQQQAKNPHTPRQNASQIQTPPLQIYQTQTPQQQVHLSQPTQPQVYQNQAQQRQASQPLPLQFRGENHDPQIPGYQQWRHLQKPLPDVSSQTQRQLEAPRPPPTTQSMPPRPQQPATQQPVAHRLVNQPHLAQQALRRVPPPHHSPATFARGPGVPNDDRIAVADAASKFLTQVSGKPITTAYINNFLQHTNDFVAMCEHFDSLGYIYGRGDMAKRLLDAVERNIRNPDGQQVDYGQQQSPQNQEQPLPQQVLPPPPPTAFYQQEAYGTLHQAGPNPGPATPPRTALSSSLLQAPVRPLSVPASAPIDHSPPTHAPPTFPSPQVSASWTPGRPGAAPDPALSWAPMPAQGHFQPPTQAHFQLPAQALSQSPTQPSLQTYSNPRPQLPVKAAAPPKPPPQPRPPLANKVVRKKAARVNRYDSTNIARNILIMIGKHPTERGLNSHLLPLRENLAGQIDWNSDMGTVRWDILDPDPIELDVGMDGDDEGDGNGQNLVSLRNSPPPVSVPKKRRRGRQPRKSAPEGLGSAALQATQHTTPSRLLGSSRHFAGSASSAAIIIEDSRSATPNRMEVDSVHVPKRRRTAATNAISTYRSTRSVKDAVNTASMGSPAFRKFQCMWTGCKAVLHNIDNLKRHVTKAHRARDPEYPDYVCKWENCYRFPTSAEIEATNKNMPGRRPPITEGKDVVHRGFPNEAELQKHLDGHIDNVRKSFGYGPAVLLSDHESGISDVDYLSDHNGQRITPTAKPSDNSHQFRPPPGFRANRQFNIAHNLNAERSQPKQSQSYQQALEKAKVLGAGMGDEVGELWARDDGRGIEIEFRRIVSADWPPKVLIN